MEHLQIREQVRKMHQELGILLSQMEAAEVPSKEADPLEGKQVEGFSGVKNIGLNCGEHHLWYGDTYNTWNVMHKEPEHPTPHHLTRVNERTVGRFYLIEDSNGDKAYHFGLYLGDKYVRWASSEVAPVNIVQNIDRLSMYEVTPTL